MKKRYGKISIIVLITFVIALLAVNLVMQPLSATPITPKDTNARLGAFTGPEGGTAQNDNIKASLDLAHTDLNAIIARTNADDSLIAGQLYAVEMTTAMTASTDDMFAVAGGPIEIVTFFGLITTVIGGAPGDINIEVDATTAAQDADFTTAVTLSDGLVGDTITYGTTTAGESVLVATANVNANLTQLSWFCPIGMIEQGLTSTGTGAITWYMVFRPLTTGVTVTAQ